MDVFIVTGNLLMDDRDRERQSYSLIGGNYPNDCPRAYRMM